MRNEKPKKEKGKMRKPIKVTQTSQYEYLGIRAHRGDRAIKIGDHLDPSYIWDDGDITDERLSGTCAIRLQRDWATGEIDEDHLVATILRVRDEYNWDGGQVILIGGDHRSYGNDIDEIIIQDAVVLAIIN